MVAVIILSGFLLSGWNLTEKNKEFRFFSPTINSDWNWDWVGPEGGAVLKISVDKVNPDIVYCASSSWCWVSNDGSSWSPLYFGFPVDLTATGSLRAVFETEDSLYYTNDGGLNWTSIMEVTDPGPLSENVDTLVYLIANGYLYKSVDGGFNWVQVAPFGFSNPHVLEYSPSNPLIIYSGAFLGDTTVVLKSSNGGITWSIVFSSSDSLILYEISDIEINPFDSNEVFISPYLGEGPTPLIYSNDGGNTWTLLQSAMDSMLFTASDVEFISQDTIIVSNYIPPKIFLGVRDTSGWTFTPLDSLPNPIDIAMGNGNIYVGTKGGIYKSVDGGATFIEISNGFKATAVWYRGQASSLIGERIFLTDAWGGDVIYRSLNGGVNWEKILNPEWIFTLSVEMVPSNPLVLYLSAFGVEIIDETTFVFHTIYKSEDGGDTWFPMDSLSETDNISFFHDIWISPSNGDRLLGYDSERNVVLLSTDGGATWDTVLSNIDSEKGFVGTDTVFIYDEGDGIIYYSLDGGLNFSPLITEIPGILDLAYDPDDGELFYARDSLLYRVDLSGNIIDSNFVLPMVYGYLETGPGNALYISGASYGYYFFGRSGDDGITMEFDTLGFIPTLIRASSNEVLIGDMGKSMRRSTDAVIGIGERESGSSGFHFSNVVNKKLMIPFELKTPGEVKLSVFDVTGRLRKRVSSKFDMGKNRISLDVGNLTNGVYFYLIETKEFSIRGKFLKISP
jgi:photosystem II stability/assembly factor-like uncharacterized protein